MLTKEDKEWVTKQLAKELNPVRDSVDLLRKNIVDVNLDKLRSDTRLNSIEASSLRTEEKVDKMLNILDGFAGKVADLEQENKMGAVTLRRHDVQIHELATATGTSISK